MLSTDVKVRTGQLVELLAKQKGAMPRSLDSDIGVRTLQYAEQLARQAGILPASPVDEFPWDIGADEWRS